MTFAFGPGCCCGGCFGRTLPFSSIPASDGTYRLPFALPQHDCSIVILTPQWMRASTSPITVTFYEIDEFDNEVDVFEITWERVTLEQSEILGDRATWQSVNSIGVGANQEITPIVHSTPSQNSEYIVSDSDLGQIVHEIKYGSSWQSITTATQTPMPLLTFLVRRQSIEFAGGYQNRAARPSEYYFRRSTFFRESSTSDLYVKITVAGAPDGDVTVQQLYEPETGLQETCPTSLLMQTELPGFSQFDAIVTSIDYGDVSIDPLAHGHWDKATNTRLFDLSTTNLSNVPVTVTKISTSQVRVESTSRNFGWNAPDTSMRISIHSAYRGTFSSFADAAPTPVFTPGWSVGNGEGVDLLGLRYGRVGSGNRRYWHDGTNWIYEGQTFVPYADEHPEVATITAIAAQLASGYYWYRIGKKHYRFDSSGEIESANVSSFIPCSVKSVVWAWVRITYNLPTSEWDDLDQTVFPMNSPFFQQSDPINTQRITSLSTGITSTVLGTWGKIITDVDKGQATALTFTSADRRNVGDYQSGFYPDEFLIWETLTVDEQIKTFPNGVSGSVAFEFSRSGTIRSIDDISFDVLIR